MEDREQQEIVNHVSPTDNKSSVGSDLTSAKKNGVGKKKRTMMAIGLLFLLVGVSFSVWFLYEQNTWVAIDTSQISAPVVDLSPDVSGILEDVFVQEGDTIAPYTAVARVGDEMVKSKSGGLIVHITNTIGVFMNPGQSVVSMINPDALRVEGRIDEDKGLARIHVGQSVRFRVDAFGSKNYYGIVDEVSPISRDSGVVFSISDKREVKQFTIKVRFDPTRYPELKSGMSARMWVRIR